MHYLVFTYLATSQCMNVHFPGGCLTFEKSQQFPELCRRVVEQSSSCFSSSAKCRSEESRSSTGQLHLSALDNIRILCYLFAIRCNCQLSAHFCCLLCHTILIYFGLQALQSSREGDDRPGDRLGDPAAGKWPCYGISWM